jgi:hypothetical protein
VQALNDDQRINSLEKKIDKGFAELRRDSNEIRAQIVSSERGLRNETVAAERGLRDEIVASRDEAREAIVAARSDARADFRTLIAVVISLWAATVLTVLAAHL